MGDTLALGAGGLAAAAAGYLLFIEGAGGLPVFAAAFVGLAAAWVLADAE